MSDKEYFVHETSFIDQSCEIGEGTKIWHFSHIMSNCKIGKKCNIGQNVVVSPDVVLGDNVKVQNNVSIYDNVHLEAEVFCGPSMVFTNVYNPRSGVERKEEYRDTIVKKGATLGANSTLVCGVTIGKYAFVGAGAVINKNVKAYALMVGVPAKQIGWMSEFGEQLDLPLHGSAKTMCPHTGEIYLLNSGYISKPGDIN